MEIVEPRPGSQPALVDATFEYIHELADEAAEEQDDIENFGSMAFDTALASASSSTTS